MSGLLDYIRKSNGKWALSTFDILDMGKWTERKIKAILSLSGETDETDFIDGNQLALKDNRRQNRNPAIQAGGDRRPAGTTASTGAPEVFPSTSRGTDLQQRRDQVPKARTAPQAADKLSSDDASEISLPTHLNADFRVGKRRLLKAIDFVNTPAANGVLESVPPPPPPSPQDRKSRQRRHTLPHPMTAPDPVDKTNGANGVPEIRSTVLPDTDSRRGRQPAPKARFALDLAQASGNGGLHLISPANPWQRDLRRRQPPDSRGQVAHLRHLHGQMRGDNWRVRPAGSHRVIRKTHLSVAESPTHKGRDPRHKLLYYLSCVRKAVDIEPLILAKDVKHLDLSRLDSLHFLAMDTLEMEEMVDLCRILSPKNLDDVMLDLGDTGLVGKDADSLVVYMHLPKLWPLKKSLNIQGVSVPILKSMAVTPAWREHFYKPVEGFDQWVSSGWYSVGFKMEPAVQGFLDSGAFLWEWGKSILSFFMQIVGVVVLFVVTLPKI